MRILYLTFYFEPDLGPGAFRNTAFVEELSRQLSLEDHIHVVTTQPNRYQSFRPAAPVYEERSHEGCLTTVERIPIPTHASGQIDQARAFITYFLAAHRLTKNRTYDLVLASSSRLFTACLGARLARRHRVPLFLDVRDLFREAILDAHRNFASRVLLSPILRAVERYTFGYATHINLVSEGFRSYFKVYPQATYSSLTNGIDDAFLSIPTSHPCQSTAVRTLLYAGNIGEGQGLHKIIPQAARQLGAGYRFVIFGEGGARHKLEEAIRVGNVTNVELHKPVARQKLLAEYQKADYLFVHLNDLNACKRVLPSKLFEYGATDKPIVAGVAGYAASFVREQLENSILFNPGDVADLVRQLLEMPYRTQVRTQFRERFQRRTISQAMVQQILQTLAEPMTSDQKVA